MLLDRAYSETEKDSILKPLGNPLVIQNAIMYYKSALGDKIDDTIKSIFNEKYVNVSAEERAENIGYAVGILGVIIGAYAKAKGMSTEEVADNVDDWADDIGEGPGGCFVAGTQVITIDGYKNIEDVAVCDYVLSKNPETGETAYKQVLNTYVRTKEKLVNVVVDGKLIETTEEHPFWIVDYGFKAAGEINAGDFILSADGEVKPIESIETVETGEVEVFNFEVEDWHTYFVSEEEVWVHNNCALKQIYNSIKESPNYPKGFEALKNGTKKVNVKNNKVLEQLRKIEKGTWKKIYKDGYDAYGNEISIHYFQSESGKVFDVKVKKGWSNS